MACTPLSIHRVHPSRVFVPLFLCPLYHSITHVHRGQIKDAPPSRPQQRKFHVETANPPAQSLPTPTQLLELPRSCPGCGAFAQITNAGQPGFYSANRKTVRAFIARPGQSAGKGYNEESETFDRIVGAANASLLSQMGLAGSKTSGEGTKVALMANTTR